MNNGLFSNILKLVIFISVFVVKPLSANQYYRIYIDADFTGASLSSQSIYQGMETALLEVNHEIDGFTFEIKVKDHKGNSRRSKKNLQQYISDQRALAVFSGLHSPPLLANKNYINEQKILLLDPWAAAAPITRSDTSENWIFRLSIDDSNAGRYITEYAVAEGFKKPYLLLEETGWGRSNKKHMTAALNNAGIKASGTSWFNWGLGINHAKVILRTIEQSGADVIFLVANANEGKIFAQAMIELTEVKTLPIRSHWGITGGVFIQDFTSQERNKLDIQFIQTRFNFQTKHLSKAANDVLSIAIEHFNELNNSQDIKAQTGFVHGYDLMKILIAAINQSGLTGDRDKDKLAIHQALEHLSLDVVGLLKIYKKPFSPYSSANPNAHEALNPEDYAMGKYNEKNDVELISER
ncbi:MAG: ABC transporter substrate-binding protein [Colwellia sp.]|nr:ABC transporter substrate-binding protein [Colwellia sp.]